MNLTVTGRHVEITSSMRNYVEDKMQRLERHSESLFSLQVILAVEKTRQTAEATVQMSGSPLFAEVTQTDMYAAIDLLIDKLDRQLIRHKEKSRDHHRRDRMPVAV